MKNYWVYMFATILVLSVSWKSSECSLSTPYVSDTLKILPFVGIGDIKLRETTHDELVKCLGKGTVNQQWRKAYEPLGIGYSIRTVRYDSSALTFIERRRKRVGRWFVAEIIIESNATQKTALGNGIGSTLSDLRIEFGNAEVTRQTGLVNGVYLDAHVVAYSNNSSIMYFYSTKSKDTSNFRVDKIWMADIGGGTSK